MKRLGLLFLATAVLLFGAADSWAPPSGGIGGSPRVLKLPDLRDVTKPLSPADNDTLIWDSTTSKWIATPESGGGTTYNAGNGLDLVGTTFSADNSVLYFDSEGTAHAGSASVHHTATPTPLPGANLSADGDTLDVVDAPVFAGRVKATGFTTTATSGNRYIYVGNTNDYSGTEIGSQWMNENAGVLRYNSAASTAETVAIASDMTSHGGDTNVHHAPVTAATISGTFTSAQIASDMARDSELHAQSHDNTDHSTNYEVQDSTLTDIADGTIVENLVNTNAPWGSNEVSTDIVLESELTSHEGDTNIHHALTFAVLTDAAVDAQIPVIEDLNNGAGAGSGTWVLATDGSGDSYWKEDATGGGGANLFETVAVSGEDNVVADITTDTLTLVAGTGISMATSATDDSVTITATGGAGTQLVYKNVATDSGTAVADSTTDTLTVIGSTGISTGASADTVTLTLEATLVDITDGTIIEDLVNTNAPWGSDEVSSDVVLESELTSHEGDTNVHHAPVTAATISGTFTSAQIADDMARDSELHNDEANADSTTIGVIEVATLAETATGTSQILAVSPDGLDAEVVAHTGDTNAHHTLHAQVTSLELSSITTIGNLDLDSTNDQPLEDTLTDIADGTIIENLVNTNAPWDSNEVAASIVLESELTSHEGDTNIHHALTFAVLTDAAVDGQIPVLEDLNNSAGAGSGTWVLATDGSGDSYWKIDATGSPAFIGTADSDLIMGGIYQVTGLQAPDTAGDAIRYTTNITETALENITDGSETTEHSHAGGSGDMVQSVWDATTDGFIDLDAGGTNIDSSAVTNGQMLIGNTTGNLFALGTITGTATETDVTVGASSLQIGIVASPTLDATNMTGGDFHTESHDNTYHSTNYQTSDATLTDLAIVPLTEAESIGDAALPTAGTFNSVLGTDVTAVTTLDIPSSDTVDSSEAGEIGIDTSDDQLIYYGAAARVIPHKFESGFSMAGTTFLATAGTFRLKKVQDGITITDIHCFTDTGTVIVELMEESATGTGGVTVDAPITCDSNGAEDDGALSNGVIDAADVLSARIGTDASTPTKLMLTYYYTVVRE